MTKVVCISDLQNLCNEIKSEMLPDGDLLLVAGDLGGWGTKEELVGINNWFGKISHKYKKIICIAGNHDECLMELDGHKILTNCTYLQDELIEVEGLRIYGTPASEMNELRQYGRFIAFCDPAYLEKVANDIPPDLDILLAHGPCYGILDKLVDGRSVGNKYMRQAVLLKKPKYFVCGHIHESHGQEEVFGTTFINAALCSEVNQMLLSNGDLYFQPIVIEL